MPTWGLLLMFVVGVSSGSSGARAKKQISYREFFLHIPSLPSSFFQRAPFHGGRRRSEFHVICSLLWYFVLVSITNVGVVFRLDFLECREPHGRIVGERFRSANMKHPCVVFVACFYEMCDINGSSPERSIYVVNSLYPVRDSHFSPWKRQQMFSWVSSQPPSSAVSRGRSKSSVNCIPQHRAWVRFLGLVRSHTKKNVPRLSLWPFALPSPPPSPTPMRRYSTLTEKTKPKSRRRASKSNPSRNANPPKKSLSSEHTQPKQYQVPW